MAVTVDLSQSKCNRREFNLARPIWVALLIGAVTSPSYGANRRAPPLPKREMERLSSAKTFVVFDWDDNVFKMPTRLILFPKSPAGNNSIENVFYVSSPELANFKNEVGVPGTPLEKFEVRTDVADPIDGSFRFTMPGAGGRNYMLEDMRTAITRDGKPLSHVPDEIKAPFYELFMSRESNEETRRANRILTGRGQTQDEFYEAVSFVGNVPEISATGFAAPRKDRVTLVGGRGHAWHQKAADLVMRMKEAANEGYTLFAFSDDDPMNIRRAAEVLAATERPVDVWLIWTREHGDSRVIDLSLLDGNSGITIETLLNREMDLTKNRREFEAEHSQHEKERAALMCRALFF